MRPAARTRSSTCGMAPTTSCSTSRRRGRYSTSSAPGWRTTPPPAASCSRCMPPVSYGLLLSHMVVKTASAWSWCSAPPLRPVSRLRRLPLVEPSVSLRRANIWRSTAQECRRAPRRRGGRAPHGRTRSSQGAVSLLAASPRVSPRHLQPPAALAEAASCLVGYGAGGKPWPGKDHLPAVRPQAGAREAVHATSGGRQGGPGLGCEAAVCPRPLSVRGVRAGGGGAQGRAAAHWEVLGGTRSL